MSDNGWVCVHRKILDSQVFINEGLFKVWMWCLLKANHKEIWVDVTTGKGVSEVKIKPGQFIFGRKSAAVKLKMKPDTVYSRMKKLEKVGNINMQNNTHYSIVTIINWDTYQQQSDNDQHPNQHPNNSQSPANQHPNNTNNNDNNEKQNISVPLKDGTFFILDNEYLKVLKDTYKNIDTGIELNKLIAWNISNPSKQKTKKGIKRHINTWISSANDKVKPASSTDISTESWF